MRKMQAALLLIVLASLAVPGKTSAQVIKSPYDFLDRKKDIGIFIGYMFADRGAAGLGANDGPLAGIQFTLRVTDPLNIGVYGAYFPSKREVIDPRAEDEAERIIGETDVDVVMLAGRLQLHLTGSRKWHNIVPIVYGGLGIVFDVSPSFSCLPGVIEGRDPNCQLTPRDRFSFGTSFLGQIGIAFSWVPRQRLGLRFTADNSIWRLTTPDGYYDETSTITPVPSFKDWTNNIQLTLGTYFWF
jgi:hypothetical protein